ncbi:hypothetical protein CEXT_280281 [Caerostris extrusa]|uniref:Uncharacterized protein n=1 Tax=Caerostris extrusa TaxID=172846 RepID=A0AAV4XJ93_CAEEX|nr:hypothetical protein CEXT_280281 [Caerostris extrusa]
MKAAFHLTSLSCRFTVDSFSIAPDFVVRNSMLFPEPYIRKILTTFPFLSESIYHRVIFDIYWKIRLKDVTGPSKTIGPYI